MTGVEKLFNLLATQVELFSGNLLLLVVGAIEFGYVMQFRSRLAIVMARDRNTRAFSTIFLIKRTCQEVHVLKQALVLFKNIF